MLLLTEETRTGNIKRTFTLENGPSPGAIEIYHSLRDYSGGLVIRELIRHPHAKATLKRLSYRYHCAEADWFAAVRLCRKEGGALRAEFQRRNIRIAWMWQVLENWHRFHLNDFPQMDAFLRGE